MEVNMSASPELFCEAFIWDSDALEKEAIIQEN